MDGPSCRFISRPGVFTYGRFDDGARAMVETAVLKPGDRVLDLGCGCGVAGVFASQQTGPEGHIAFVDSNIRAVALTELNARANGVASSRPWRRARWRRCGGRAVRRGAGESSVYRGP